MKKLILYIIPIIISCSEPEIIPADVLPQQRMAEVLADVELLEARIQMEQLERNDSTKNLVRGYYKTIFNKHKITPDQFRKSFDYYSQHMDKMDQVYQEVITNLSKGEAMEANK